LRVNRRLTSIIDRFRKARLWLHFTNSYPGRKRSMLHHVGRHQ